MSETLVEQSTPQPFHHERVTVARNERIAKDTYSIRLNAPLIARAIRPGQFVMVRIPRRNDPLLGRPYALYDTVVNAHGEVTGFDIGYLVVGKQTELLSRSRIGDVLDIWGPLGNGFPLPDNLNHVAMIAGGIGQTPFLAYARALLGLAGYGGRAPRQRTKKVSIYYGVRSRELLAGVDDFRNAGADVHLSTDDGSFGYHGFVTNLLDQHMQLWNSGKREDPAPEILIGCGPQPMLRVLARLGQKWSVPTLVSLESPMACGAGICFSCVAPVRTNSGWDYKRICVDGPVFEADKLVWD